MNMQRPQSFSGKWICWERSGKKIVGWGNTLEVAVKRAKLNGHEKYILERIPKNLEPLEIK